jgi:hypothetical protein
MEAICLSPMLLGESSYLLCTGKGYCWIKNPTKDSWIVGPHPQTQFPVIEELASLSSMSLDTSLPESFVKMMETLGAKEPKWSCIIPRPILHGFIRRVLDSSRVILNEGCIGYYVNSFLSSKRCLLSVDRAAIDWEILQRKIKEADSEGLRSTLSTFVPDATGFANPVRYSLLKSATGRMVIESGPRILTLSKEHRDIIKSRYEGGKVFVFDFRSWEPRLLLALTGREMTGDIYNRICQDDITREQAKIVTIMTIYGASASTINSHLKVSIEIVDRKIRLVEDMFGIDGLRERLSNELNECGFIKSFYGRIVKVPNRHAIINRYVQTTGVDAALSGFNSAIEFIRDKKIRAKPIFFIHDAMLLDIHPDDFGYIESIASMCGRISGFSTVFPAAAKELTNA